MDGASTAIHATMFSQIRFGGADLFERGARSGGTGHLLVLLRESTLVLRRKETSLSRSTFAGRNLVEKGKRRYFYEYTRRTHIA